MTIEQELIKAQAGLNAAKQDLEEAQGHVARLTTDLATAKQTIGTLSADRDKFIKLSDQLASENLKMEADCKAALDAKDAEVEKRAHLRSNEIARAQGVPPVREETAPNTRSGEDIATQLAAITDPVKRAEFYRQNKDAIASAFKPRSK